MLDADHGRVGVMDGGVGVGCGLQYLLDNEEEEKKKKKKKKITDLNVTQTTPYAVSYWSNVDMVLHNNLVAHPLTCEGSFHKFASPSADDIAYHESDRLQDS
jgi:hypothetical protein